MKKDAKTNLKIIVSAVCVILLFTAVASAAKVTLTTEDGPVTVEGDENIILKLLKLIFSPGDRITGASTVNTTCTSPITLTSGYSDSNVVCTGLNCVVQQDITFCADGIIINQDGVNLDCNGKTLTGSGTGNGVKIYYLKSGVTVQNCNVNKFTLGIWSNGGNNNIITNNMANNDVKGIWLQRGSGHTVTGNTVSSSDYGILADISSNNAITGNTVTNSSAIGISLASSSNNNVVKSNAISGPGGEGIRIFQDSNNTVTLNTVSGVNYGIMISAETTAKVTLNNISASYTHLDLRWTANNNMIYYNNLLGSPTHNLVISGNSQGQNNTFDDGICAGNYAPLNSTNQYPTFPSYTSFSPNYDNYSLANQWPNGYDNNNNGIADCAEVPADPCVQIEADAIAAGHEVVCHTHADGYTEFDDLDFLNTPERIIRGGGNLWGLYFAGNQYAMIGALHTSIYSGTCSGLMTQYPNWENMNVKYPYPAGIAGKYGWATTGNYCVITHNAYYRQLRDLTVVDARRDGPSEGDLHYVTYDVSNPITAPPTCTQIAAEANAIGYNYICDPTGNYAGTIDLSPLGTDTHNDWHMFLAYSRCHYKGTCDDFVAGGKTGATRRAYYMNNGHLCSFNCADNNVMIDVDIYKSSMITPSYVVYNVTPYVPCTDADGDGYAIEGGNCGPIDCDDNDQTQYPGTAKVTDANLPWDNIGECREEISQCDGNTGNYGVIQAKITPQAEICDNKDNDCDGIVDGITQYCYTGPVGTDNVGICHGGTQTCTAGQWGACVGEVTPQPEVCDGFDDDCNGVVDDKDSDNDGFNDCDGSDKCVDLSLPSPSASFIELKPNHYVWDAQLGHGCTCEEVLYCKPGTNSGEYKFGCSMGTLNVWTLQTGWSPECQVGGIVAMEGVSKPLFANTDSDWVPDIFDADNDNDGVPDSDDDMIEDSDLPGDPDYGIPDWHPKSKHNQ